MVMLCCDPCNGATGSTQLLDDTCKYVSFSSTGRVCRVLESQLPELAACAEEVTLKHLLWTSLESWGQLTHELSRTEFSKLDADNLEAVVGQYARTALKIEKGLSPNQVCWLASHPFWCMTEVHRYHLVVRCTTITLHSICCCESCVIQCLGHESYCIAA